MKRVILAVLISVCVALVPVAAQSTGNAAEFISFNLGVPLGYDLTAETFDAGYNFGISFVVLNNLSVGYDRVLVNNNTAIARSFDTLRMAYSFLPILGAAVSFGTEGGAVPAIGLGVFSNIIQSTTTQGIKYGLNLRIEYLTNTDDFGGGAILFTTGIKFGI